MGIHQVCNIAGIAKFVQYCKSSSVPTIMHLSPIIDEYQLMMATRFFADNFSLVDLNDLKHEYF